MNPKKFFVGVGVLLIIGLLIGLFSLFLKDGEPDEKLPGKVVDRGDDLDIDRINRGADEVKLDFDTPTEEEEEEIVDADYLREALAKKDESLCHDIELASIRTKCFDGTRFARALDLNDAKLCSEIDDDNTRQFCIDQIALNDALFKKDYASCGQIGTAVLQKKCLDAADSQYFLHAGAAEDCNKITDTSVKEECVLRFQARDKLLNDGLCQEINDVAVRDSCEDQLLISKAVSTGDATVCREVKNVADREACKRSVEQKIQLEWAQQAAEQGDTKSCAIIIDQALKAKCEDKANFQAMRTYKDIGFCEKIVDAELKALCLREENTINLFWQLRAEKEKNAEYCEKITDEEMRTSCQKLGIK